MLIFIKKLRAIIYSSVFKFILEILIIIKILFLFSHRNFKVTHTLGKRLRASTVMCKYSVVILINLLQMRPLKGFSL